MRISIIVLMGLIGLVAAWSLGGGSASSQVAGRGATAPAGAGSWLVVQSAGAQGSQQLVLIDPGSRKMASYQISSSGEIALKCVRNITWDLQLDQFNAARPTPDEIRAMLPQTPSGPR